MCADMSEEDDFSKAFTDENEIHINYAHSISLGFNKERYYVVFIVRGKNFLWMTPSTSRLEPEELLRDFCKNISHLTKHTLLLTKIRYF